MVGYSRRSLAAKLGIKPGERITVLAAPRGYRRTLGALPPGARVGTTVSRPASFIHLFCTRRAILERRFPPLARALAPAGMLWISWPKRASGVATDVTEDVVRGVGLATGLVDVKVCAVDETWSALKFLRRLADRP